jgi:SNF family Na+-dependent transporter
LGVAVGSQLLLSSYNGFNANAHRDALFIAFGNSATSMYAGVVVFGVVGFIANEGPVLQNFLRPQFLNAYNKQECFPQGSLCCLV